MKVFKVFMLVLSIRLTKTVCSLCGWLDGCSKRILLTVLSLWRCKFNNPNLLLVLRCYWNACRKERLGGRTLYRHHPALQSWQSKLQLVWNPPKVISYRCCTFRVYLAIHSTLFSFYSIICFVEISFSHQTILATTFSQF